MLLVTTALSGLMAGLIQTAPVPVPPQTPPPTQDPAPRAPADLEVYVLDDVNTTTARPRGSVNSDIPPDITPPTNRSRPTAPPTSPNCCPIWSR